MQVVSLTCLWLAAKLEEVEKLESNMWKVLLVFDRVTKRKEGKGLALLEMHSKVKSPLRDHDCTARGLKLYPAKFRGSLLFCWSPQQSGGELREGFWEGVQRGFAVKLVVEAAIVGEAAAGRSPCAVLCGETTLNPIPISIRGDGVHWRGWRRTGVGESSMMQVSFIERRTPFGELEGVERR